ncbi:MAG TPA: flippase [Nitrospirota bacterium]|nr:flippase [Nitrospirota bacterium]
MIQNTGFVFIAGVFDRIFSLFFIIYAARILGPGDFGLYALIGTVTFLFFYFGNLGIGPMAIRDIARDKTKAEELFSHILSLRISLVILSYPFIVLVVNLLGYPDDVKHLIYVAGLSAIFSTFSSSFDILYKAFERFKAPSVISVLVSFLRNMSNILILYLGFGLNGIIWISFLGAFLGAVISGLWIRSKFLKYRFAFDLSTWKNILLHSMPFAILSFFQQANRHLNILLLSKLPGPFPGDVAMGYYNPPSSVGKVAMMLPESFRQAALPTISSNAENIKIVGKIIDRSTKSLLVMVIFPLILATTFFPEEIITIIFGKEYLPSAPALTVFGWAYAFQVFNAPVTATLSASKEIKRFIPWAMLVLGINIILAVPLILYYSFLGAAIAFLVSKVIETAFRRYLLQNIWGIRGLDLQGSFKLLAPMAIIFVMILLAYLSSVSTERLLIFTAILYLAYVFSIRDLREGVISFIGGLR